MYYYTLIEKEMSMRNVFSDSAAGSMTLPRILSDSAAGSMTLPQIMGIAV